LKGIGLRFEISVSSLEGNGTGRAKPSTCSFVSDDNEIGFVPLMSMPRPHSVAFGVSSYPQKTFWLWIDRSKVALCFEEISRRDLWTEKPCEKYLQNLIALR
jgi:hypothetical protein